MKQKLLIFGSVLVLFIGGAGGVFLLSRLFILFDLIKLNGGGVTAICTAFFICYIFLVEKLPLKKLFEEKNKTPVEEIMPWMDSENVSRTAAVYIRVDPEYHYSANTTLEFGDLSLFAKKLGLSIGNDCIFSDHCEADVPLKERPGFLRMVRACRENDRPFDLILVDHSSHLTSMPDDLVFLYALLIKWFGVALVFRRDMQESKRLYLLDHQFASSLYVTGDNFGFNLPETRPIHPIERDYFAK